VQIRRELPYQVGGLNFCSVYDWYKMEYKVVVLGDKGVGKTCLVLRFIEGYFMAKQQSTVGAFFLTKKVTLPDGTSIKMQIWDTAGQERFRAMAPVRRMIL
jgi:Ras-related protein Rab-21